MFLKFCILYVSIEKIYSWMTINLLIILCFLIEHNFSGLMKKTVYKEGSYVLQEFVKEELWPSCEEGEGNRPFMLFPNP